MSVDAVRAIAVPIVSAANLDLEDLTIDKVGRRNKVTVIVDGDGGVDLDVIAEVSHAISVALDEQPDSDDSPFVLEVTSPGVDRPLTQPRHWRRANDRLVSIEMTDGTSVTGRIISSDDDSAEVEISGQTRDILFSGVANAVVQVEFDRKKDS